jgi:hypothetical protein
VIGVIRPKEMATGPAAAIGFSPRRQPPALCTSRAFCNKFNSNKTSNDKALNGVLYLIED